MVHGDAASRPSRTGLRRSSPICPTASSPASSSSWSSPSAPACSARPTASCTNARGIVLEPSAARDRLTPDLAYVEDDGGFARLERAFKLVAGTDAIAKRMRAAHIARLEGRGGQGRDHAGRGRAACCCSRSRHKSDRGRRFCAGGAVADLQENRTMCISSSRNSVNRGRRADGTTGFHRRRQPDAVPEGALGARAVHAGRSRRAMRPAAAGAPAVRARLPSTRSSSAAST